MGKKPLTPAQRERRRASNKRWEEKNREKRRAWRDDNRERRIAYIRRWRAKKTRPTVTTRPRAEGIETGGGRVSVHKGTLLLAKRQPPRSPFDARSPRA
jgi:hypothetical protein